jgi:hypothetical protein
LSDGIYLRGASGNDKQSLKREPSSRPRFKE